MCNSPHYLTIILCLGYPFSYESLFEETFFIYLYFPLFLTATNLISSTFSKIVHYGYFTFKTTMRIEINTLLD
jgi:hypothetical protein